MMTGMEPQTEKAAPSLVRNNSIPEKTTAAAHLSVSSMMTGMEPHTEGTPVVGL